MNTVKGIHGIHPGSRLTEQSQILFNINSEVKVVRATYYWTPVICHTTSNRVQIPFSLEILAVVVDGGQEEMVQKPEMARVLAVKTVEPSETCEKCSPSASKLGADLHPEPFNASVTRRPKNMQ
jgi:hypothetical protein